jgi:hypothetical protein
MPSISEQLERDNKTGKVKLKEDIEKLTLDVYYQKKELIHQDTEYELYIKFDPCESKLLRDYIIKPNNMHFDAISKLYQNDLEKRKILKFTYNNIYYSIRLKFNKIYNNIIYDNSCYNSSEINILKTSFNFNIIEFNEIYFYNDLDFQYVLTGFKITAPEHYKIQFFLEPLRKQLDNQTNEINNLKQLLTEQQSEIKQLKEKNKENEIEIHYLKCANQSKKITYDYNQIKKQNAKLNKEFLRIYKLIKKNIGYNLSD